MTEQKPSIGRIVHVRAPGFFRDVTFPAIVTRAYADEPDRVDVTAFPPGSSPLCYQHVELRPPGAEGYGVELGWHWPPRVG